MHEPYMSHSLVRTNPFYTSPFCRIPVVDQVASSLKIEAAMSAISVFTLPETKDTKQDAVPSKSLAADCDALKEGIGEQANYGSGFRSV